VQCRIELDPCDLSVDMNYAIVLFRIFQEALTNVIKHARATAVNATLTLEKNRIVLVINDDGVGISDRHVSGSSYFGLIGMRDRLYTLGGTILVNGKKNRGTTLKVVIPVSAGMEMG
jgi:signal transduction histidine kinase